VLTAGDGFRLANEPINASHLRSLTVTQRRSGNEDHYRHHRTNSVAFPSGVEVERETLATEDYSLAGLTEHVAIERKSRDDFISCGGGRALVVPC
jgi:hypothetical protein